MLCRVSGRRRNSRTQKLKKEGNFEAMKLHNPMAHILKVERQPDPLRQGHHPSAIAFRFDHRSLIEKTLLGTSKNTMR